MFALRGPSPASMPAPSPAPLSPSLSPQPSNSLIVARTPHTFACVARSIPWQRSLQYVIAWHFKQESGGRALEHSDSGLAHTAQHVIPSRRSLPLISAWRRRASASGYTTPLTPVSPPSHESVPAICQSCTASITAGSSYIYYMLLLELTGLYMYQVSTS